MNNNSENKVLKEYTIYQIQNLFGTLLLSDKNIKECTTQMDILQSTGSSDSIRYRNLEKIKTDLENLQNTAQNEVEYILQNPTKVIIKEIPIRGILNQRRIISELNRNSDNKIRKLRSMFFEIKDKFALNHNYIPEEYSTKYLDNSIQIHKESIRKLLKLKEKLSGYKEVNPIPNDNRSIFDKIIDCPNPFEENFYNVFQEGNERVSFQEKQQRLQKEEQQLRKEEERSILNFRNFLDKSFKTI